MVNNAMSLLFYSSCYIRVKRLFSLLQLNFMISWGMVSDKAVVEFAEFYM